MSPIFELDKHYNNAAKVANLEVEHVHWRNEDGKLVSLFKVGLRTRSAHRSPRTMVCDFNVWDVTPEELRALSEAMTLAADDLAAHERQIAGGVAP